MRKQDPITKQTKHQNDSVISLMEVENPRGKKKNPDFRLQMLEEIYGREYPISCSKCHHCR